MNNPFNAMSDEEFLYQICAFMGKENFIRFIDITNRNCPNSRCINEKDKCGECFYEFLREYEKNNKEVEEC
ncbi:hypothetical protein SAMN02745163_02075 [Clostridium cavendishii DSM 21758]|uniref:Uncharacterized protein n=1 Tax=Clostridium cavendishii DSM 21758 TaxID=1121302 RepID=A0A1M6K1Y8_9CLOT|nr:hypothetical protein [Clostridium cavendishii]SHJ52935.1 hypothetical protein SAMN02745163_02075 [Clostridium cavendishii DSM 21758]